MEFSLSELNNALGDIRNLSEGKRDFLNFKNISIDSRTLLKNDLFIAIKGKNFDGHSFLLEVLNKGVKSVVIKKGMQKLLPSNFPYWVVNDTAEAFQKLALLKRKKLNIPIVAITGSVGKTTTKEMIGGVLNKLGRIKLSHANFNNEIGVGLTILATDIEDKVLVLEMGMRGLGQIENLSKYSEPDIAVITNIGTAHIGLLGSKKNITYAKCEISKYLNPEGVVIIPANDPFLEKTLKEFWKGRVIKVKLLNIENQKESFKKDYNLRGFYNPLNKKILIEKERLKEINETEYHEILINHTTPYSPFDILENKSLLLENNFDNLNAIDWDKGCYVGQEITARMKYRGLLKKKLYALKIKSGDVLEGDELIVDNKKIGTIVSKANSNIFAALNINFVNEISENSYLSIKSFDDTKSRVILSFKE